MRRSELVYKGRIIRVYKDKMLLPSGAVSEFDVVRHPRAVLVVPLVSDNKVILLRQFRPVNGGYLYELPAGTIERGESPLACAKREIMEEAGFRAKK